MAKITLDNSKKNTTRIEKELVDPYMDWVKEEIKDIEAHEENVKKTYEHDFQMPKEAHICLIDDNVINGSSVVKSLYDNL